MTLHCLHCPKCYKNDPFLVNSQDFWTCNNCGFHGIVDEFNIPVETLVVANFSHPLSTEAKEKLILMWNAVHSSGEYAEICVNDVYDVKVAQKYTLGADTPLDRQVNEQLERLEKLVGVTSRIDVIIPPALSFPAYLVGEAMSPAIDLAVIAPVPDNIPTRYLPSQLITA